MKIQEQINFTTWSTEELRDWVEAVCLNPSLETTYNFKTCLQAVEELNIREGIYEEIKSIHRC